jgi:hypothetical protein
MRLLATTVVLLLAVSTRAAELTVEPGLWAFEVESRNPFLPAPVIQRFRDCVEARRLDPSRFLQDFGDCTWEEEALRSDELAWTFRCDTHNGAAEGNGRMRSTGTTLEGRLEIALDTPGAERPLTLVNRWEGRRVADRCGEE